MKLIMMLLSLFLGIASATRLLKSDRSLSLGLAKQEDEMPAAAIKRVIDMLNNLITEMDAEAAKDEESFAEFQSWCTRQQEVTQTSIDALTSQIEELTANLAELYSQKSELEAYIAKLTDEIELTKRQIQMATEKRQEENAAFHGEQQDFANSIAACGKAMEILSAHYGDGTEHKAEKPSWMSFVAIAHKVRATIQRRGTAVQPQVMNLIQNADKMNGPNDRYQANTGEGLNIVDQMQELSDTFAADKQSAIDEENRLQKLYDDLMTEKTQLLNSLIKERDERQAVLNAVNQEIGEKETAKANAEAELKDEQAYLAAVKKSCEDTAILFEQRKKDRAAEKLATQEAIKVLGGSAGEAFIQGSQPALIQQSARHHTRSNGKVRRACPACQKAASLLSQAATTLRSGTLATAAAATMGTDAVADVIQALHGLIKRLDEDQKMETEHKEWCETEISETTMKKEHHEAMVEELTQKIADETEVIAEKKQAIQDTIDSIARADQNWAELTRIREEEKAAFETELQNYKDALNALNQAIDILSKFYASKKKSLLQQGVAPREMAPGVFDSAYQMKGGAGVIDMIATVRGEYEQGKADLEKAEQQAVDDYTAAKAQYEQMRRDLVTQQDRLTVQLQTAEANLARFQDDKVANQEEVAAAKSYLGQLSNSCNSLLKNYDNRVKLRREEKEAIEKAIDVLENETF